MAVKYPKQCDGMYTGNMQKSQMDMLLQIRDMKCVESLKKYIYNFTPEIILGAVNEGISPLKYCALHGIDTKDYIGELRDYQTVGVAFMYYSPRSMLGDGVGLGKTVEVSALLNVLRVKGELTKFLIAVETSAVGQVQSEIMRFTGLNVVELPSRADKFRRAIEKIDWSTVDGAIIKHSSLKSDVFLNWIAKYVNELGQCTLFNTFILDESSVIKNDSTKMYNYTQNICNCMQRVHLLNATAFEICLMDIYCQVDMMDPYVLPKKWRIEKEYCTYEFKPYWVKIAGQATMKKSRQRTGYKNEENFKNSLKLFYFGRPKQVALGESDHIYKVYCVEPTLNQLSAIKKKFRYMEVLNCPSLVPEAGIEFTRKDVPKLERLVQLIEGELSNSKVMVYCFHIEAQHQIRKELEAIGKKVELLNGKMKDEERKRIIDSFNVGDTDILVTNVKKSLNLYNGDACIFYSQEVNPSNMFQISGRIDRNVDDKIKTYIMLVYEGTPEYDYLTSVVAQRGKDARALTIDAKTTIDYFMEALEEMGD